MSAKDDRRLVADAEAGRWDALRAEAARRGVTDPPQAPDAILEALADALTDAGSPDVATRLDRVRLAFCEALVAREDTADHRIRLGSALADLGDGDALDAAPAWYARAREVLARVPGVDGARHTALVCARAAIRADEADDLAESERLFRAAVDTLRPHAPGGDPRVLRGLLSDLLDLDRLVRDPDDPPGELLEEAVALARRYARADDPDPQLLGAAAAAMGELAECANDPDAARALAEEQVALCRRVLALDPGDDAEDALDQAEALYAALREGPET